VRGGDLDRAARRLVTSRRIAFFRADSDRERSGSRLLQPGDCETDREMLGEGYAHGELNGPRLGN
jgi:hypothetical protein